MLPTLKAEISDVPSMGESSQPVGVFSQSSKVFNLLKLDQSSMGESSQPVGVFSQSSKVRPVFNPSGLSCFIKGSLLLSVRPFDSIIYPRGFIPFTDKF